MTDFKLFVKAMKLTWLHWFSRGENQTWHLILENSLEVNLNYFLQCNYTKEDIPASLPNFYKQILAYSTEVMGKEPTEYNDIITQNIWFNRFITTKDKKTLFFKKWYEKGIRIVSDVIFLNNEGQWQFLRMRDIESLLNDKVNFMEYFSLFHAFPKKWFEILNQEDHFSNESSSLSEYSFDSLPPSIKGPIIYAKSKMYYKLLVEDLENKATGPLALAREYNVLPVDVINSFTDAQEITKSSKILILQYKITHRIVACNSFLHQTKIRNNDICNFCNQVDSVRHFFFDCETTRQFWHDLELWTNNIENSSEILDLNLILFGANPTSSLLAFLILFGKWFIYKAKIKKSPPINMRNFKLFPKSQYKIEKQALVLNFTSKKEKCFKTIWQSLFNQV